MPSTPPTPPTTEPTALADLGVLAHPLRLQLLSLLTSAPMSAAEAARAIGHSHAGISYHLRRLHAAGLVDLVEETCVRGGRAKRYRHLPRPQDGPRTGDPEADQAFTAALGAELRRRVAAKRPGAPATFTDAEVWVPAPVWAQALALLQQMAILVHEHAQPPRSPATVRISVTACAFPMIPAHPAPALSTASAAEEEQ